ncbi:hypothetical protein OVA07_07220 [Novosphingobium sp. SL115]|uniref:hypothetical protein n=1 Tax=Novosphingobium sp. SL115 TaxID=2995150 RepID=UPI002275CA94|nr:hypothetical protein [Novosphingobium sp. SL115]MCY1670805.1 hypothetical protein [Novosphingobium sp. SL115]
MIAANAPTGELAARLTQKAQALATARAVMMSRRLDARRWRKASLLWPLFGEE